MNETYQHPGKWHEYHIKPTAVRTDNTHYIMSYVIKNLEHNAVYEAIVQARNKYGWNEVSPRICKYIVKKSYKRIFFNNDS